MLKTVVRVERQNDREYGYGLYVNCYVHDSHTQFGDHGIWASECVPFNADVDTILRATRRVRQRGRSAFRRAARGG